MGYYYDGGKEVHAYLRVSYRCIDVDVRGGEVITELSMSKSSYNQLQHFNLRTRKANGVTQYLEHNSAGSNDLYYTDVGSGMACGYSASFSAKEIYGFGLAFLRKVSVTPVHSLVLLDILLQV